MVADYFNSMDIGCKLHKNGKRQRVLFSISGTQKFFYIIAPMFPTFALGRL